MATKTGGPGNDILNGTSAADTLYGRGGNDTLNGLASVDQLYGEAGNDTLRGGLGNDRLDGGSGVDTASYSDATGDVEVRLDSGISSGNRGVDTLVSIENATGGAYNDVLYGTNGNNILRGSNGNDVIGGFGGDDRLYGGSGDDDLYGYDGNDRLAGGLGSDTLIGFAGLDTFAFETIQDTGHFDDRIFDFTQGEDRVDVSLIDANVGVAGNQAFTFLGNDTNFTAPGQAGYFQIGGFTYVYLNNDADSTAESAFGMDGTIDLAASDFVL